MKESATTTAERDQQIGAYFTQYLHEARQLYEAGKGTREDIRPVWVRMHCSILSLAAKEYGEMFLRQTSTVQDELTSAPERFPFDEFYSIVTLLP